MEFKSETFKDVKGFKKAYSKMRNDIIEYFELGKIDGYVFHMPNNYVTLYGNSEIGTFALISGSIADFKEWIKFSKSDTFFLKVELVTKNKK